MNDDDVIYDVLSNQRRWMRLREIARDVGTTDLVAVRAGLERLARRGWVRRSTTTAHNERPLWGANTRRAT
jgi:predicted DNA-binding transcriptional regulator